MDINEEFWISIQTISKIKINIYPTTKKENILKIDQVGPGFEPQTPGYLSRAGSPFKISVQVNVKINSKMVRTLWRRLVDQARRQLHRAFWAPTLSPTPLLSPYLSAVRGRVKWIESVREGQPGRRRASPARPRRGAPTS